MALTPSTRLGRYEIRSILGAGGMGEVYLAEDLTLHRKVAIKVLRADVISNKDRLARFELEAFAASSLNHPNILTIHEIGNEGEYHFMATEFIDGESLGQCLKVQPLTVPEVLEVGIQVASALAAAHAAGIVHRDIKPDNIMLRRDHLVKVLDFGLAKLNEPEHSDVDREMMTLAMPLTTPGMVMGTARYMSPEQARGLPVDERTDIWSLGVVLYQLVGSHLPFTGRTMSDVIAAVLTAQPPVLSTYAPDVPAELQRIISKALRKDAAERYQLVREFGQDLKNLQQSLQFEAQLVRSGRGERVSTERSSQELTTVVHATRPTAEPETPNDGHIHTTSSAEYLVGQVKRHKLGMVLILGTIIIAATGVAVFYWRLHKPVVPLTDKDTIVLADFVNTTGDAVFDDALKQALAVELGQSPFLSIVSDGKVRATLQQMTKPPTERLTDEIAREVCQRSGGKAYISGSIASLGNQYVIGLNAINCGTNDPIAREQVQAAGKEKVLDALGNATTKLRGELGESLSSVQKFDVPLDQATTPSLEALKAFSLGRKQSSAAAIPFYERAIELDPNFAAAYARLGVMYRNIGQPARASEYVTKAFALREHASERDKLYIAASYYRDVTGEQEKCIQALTLWAQSYPRDWLPFHNLGVAYSTIGQYEKAVEAARESLRIYPDNVTAYENLAGFYLALNRLPEARETTDQALARKLDEELLHTNAYSLAFLQGDSAAMAQQVAWFEGKADVENEILALESATEAYSGRLGKARELMRRAVASAEGAKNQEAAAFWSAEASLWEALFGNYGAARDLAGSALTLAPGSRDAESEAALALALAGDATRAQSLTDDLNKRFPLNTMTQSLWLPAIRAQFALGRKTPFPAIELLQTAAPYELGQVGQLNYSCIHPAYIRGQAYVASGQGAAAAAEFQKIVDHRGLVQNCPTAALAHLGLARAYALQGDSEKGKAAYRDFLTLWKDADPDIPILKESKAEFEKMR